MIKCVVWQFYRTQRKLLPTEKVKAGVDMRHRFCCQIGKIVTDKKTHQTQNSRHFMFRHSVSHGKNRAQCGGNKNIIPSPVDSSNGHLEKRVDLGR